MSTSLITSFPKIGIRRLYTFGIGGSSSASWQLLRTVGAALLVGSGYYIGALIGFAWTPSGQPNSSFWPANAILLAALLLAPRRMWWSFVLVVFPAHMAAQLHAGVPPFTALGWFVSNTSEALMGAFCITALTSPSDKIESVRGLLIFVVFGVLLAPFATSFLDASAVVMTGWGRGYWPLSLERFWTNALAEITIVPLVVLCGSKGISWIRTITASRSLEAILLAITILSSAVLTFGFTRLWLPTIPALLLLPFPLLLWAAVRFDLWGLGLSLLSIAMIWMWFTVHGQKPLPYASIPQNILYLQILLCVAAVPLMFLSVVISESNRNEMSLRRISGSLIEAQEQERLRIARELHDNLAQQLALVKVKLDRVIEGSGEAQKGWLIDISDHVMAMCATTREISHGLYPSQLEYLGLAKAVKRLCIDMRGEFLSISLTVPDVLHQLQPSIALCLYRITQEALHNILAHSQANNVQVELGSDDRLIWLRIADDGVGFDPRGGGEGLGISSMRQRVVSVGGTIDITSSPNTGTQIEVRVPLSKEDMPIAA